MFKSEMYFVENPTAAVPGTGVKIRELFKECFGTKSNISIKYVLSKCAYIGTDNKTNLPTYLLKTDNIVISFTYNTKDRDCYDCHTFVIKSIKHGKDYEIWSEIFEFRR